MFRATNPFSNRRQSGVLHFPGLALGGPAAIPRLFDGRGRTFWFVSAETVNGSSMSVDLNPTVPIEAWRRGDFDGAIAYHRQALPLFEKAGAEALLLTELHWLGDAYRDRGDFDDGERVLEETATRARELGFDQQLTSTLHSLGDLSLDRGHPDTALQRFAEALAYAVTTGSRRVQIYCVAGIACALLQQGDDRAAARLWGTAEDQERQLGFRMLLTERQRYEHLVAGARERLGRDYELERRAGAGLTLEEAVAEARQHVPASFTRLSAGFETR